MRSGSGELLADSWQAVPVISDPGLGFCVGPYEYGTVEIVPDGG